MYAKERTIEEETGGERQKETKRWETAKREELIHISVKIVFLHWHFTVNERKVF